MGWLAAILQPLFGALFRELFAMLQQPTTGEIGADNSGSLSGWVREDDAHDPSRRERGDVSGKW